MQIKLLEPSSSVLTAELCELAHDSVPSEAVAEIIIAGTWYSVMMCRECLLELYKCLSEFQAELQQSKDQGVF